MNEMTNETTCTVDHDERRAMGLQNCYLCNAVLQSEADALSIREAKQGLTGKDWQRWVELKLAEQERATRIIVAALGNESLMRQVRESYAIVEKNANPQPESPND